MTDDHPQLPEGISKGLEDVLLRCFQRDEKIRISAQKLLKHPWIGTSGAQGGVCSSFQREVVKWFKQDDTELINIKNELSDYNKQLQEVGKKVQKTAYASIRGPGPRRPRSASQNELTFQPKIHQSEDRFFFVYSSSDNSQNVLLCRFQSQRQIWHQV